MDKNTDSLSSLVGGRLARCSAPGTRRVVLLCLGLAGAVSGGHVAGAQVRGGTLGYAERPGIGSLNPYQSINATAPTDRALSMIYEPLFRYNFLKNDGWESVLAASNAVPAVATRGGHSAFAVNLRPNVLWHDGTPFTAEDVIFTYNYIKHASQNRLQRESIGKLLVDVRRGASPLQVVFEFSRVVTDARYELGDFIIPANRFRHPAAFVASSAVAVALEPVSNEKDLDRDPMGTGPYRFDKVEYGLPALVSFPRYHGGVGNLERIAGRELTDQSLMVETFLTNGGPLQLIVEVPPKSLQRIEKSGIAEFDHVPAFNVLSVVLRQKPGSVLLNERVRRALTMAVNRDQILETWFGGKGEVVASPIMHQSPYWDATVKALKFDTALAKQEIKALVPPNSRLTFIYLNAEIGSDTHISDMVASIKESLEAMGLKIDLQGRPYQYFSQSLQKGDFDMALVRWEFNPAYNIAPFFHSSNAASGGLNFMNFKDAQFDQWLQAYDDATDENRRQNLMTQMQKYLNTKAPAIFLLSEDKVYAYHTRYSLPPGTVDPFNFFTYARQWWRNPR